MSSKNIYQTYIKYDHITHVKNRPGMYIGSIDEDTIETWILNNETKMEKKSLKYIPGLFKIFDEILVNACDHEIRLKTKKSENEIHQMKNLKVLIDKETGIIEVFNDGDGIDIIEHPTEKVYIPEMIFGHMLSSSNYDDSEERTIGGQNGIGAKACNIFSKWFEIETVDHTRNQKYIQKFENNMTVINKPKITKCSKKPYTIIRFLPDYQSFKMNSLTDDMYKIMEKRVYDMCAVTGKDVSVCFNGNKINCKTFEKYADLYIGTKEEHTRVYEQINERWEVIASYNDFNGFEHISFVNGVWTIKGGKHLEYILSQITKKLTELITKKHKDTNIKPQTVRENLILFVKSTIVNPIFDSQSKETLSTPSSKFGSKAEISDKFIDKLYKSGIVQKILEINQIQNQKDLKKTDGKKKKTIKGIYKLDDANLAGTDKSKDCTLILTEGDSAKTMAIAGLSKVGRDKYGVFPLRGKLMNVKEMNTKKIMENEEVSNLKKILGLESGKTYEDINELRYGKIMIMTDADEDGKHIKGLLFNLFHTLWPSLLKKFNFLTSMMTPIIKATKGKTSVSFYNMSDYEKWKNELLDEGNTLNKWTIKYYKGLGTSTEEEAIEYFKNLKTTQYEYNGKETEDSLDLAFNKKRADDRKQWLSTYNNQEIIESNINKITYSEFIHKELKHFSNYDLERSIPNVMDGFKTSLRKIFYSCLKKNIYDKEIKVAQLAGYVSETASYHHGEASLQTAIVGMAQDFIGSNNINLLLPKGQFGSRVQGGKDASQPRYIYTLMNNLTSSIFKTDDSKILNYKNEDGDNIEPDYYLPILPMILVNGAIGIGTGFSTNIPCYNPLDITKSLKNLINNNEDNNELTPWYCGFTGTITNKENKYTSKGIYNRLSPTKVEVTELPIGFWTEDFKKLCEELLDEKNTILKSYESNYTHLKVNFVLNFTSEDELNKLLEINSNGETKFDTMFKMTTSKLLSTTNMYLFNSKCQIQKYNTPNDIIKYFYEHRLLFFEKRKEKLLEELQNEIDIKDNKIRFITDCISKKVIVYEFTKQQLEEYFEKQKYLKIDNNFSYLMNIPVYKLTKDEMDKLNKELESLKEQYNIIKNKTIQQMWLEDIDEFENKFSKYLETRLDKYNEKPKEKKAVSSVSKTKLKKQN